MSDSLSRFAALGAALAERGLGIQLPLSAAAVDRLPASRGLPSLRSLWNEARGSLLVGSGGGTFFERFRRATAVDERDPLDAFTRREIELCCEAALGPRGFSLKFPFVPPSGDPVPVLSFQALGRAAGAPGAGPLGIVVLREWGPWWAFRALVLLPFEVPSRAPILDVCASCAAPCLEACPSNAVARDGFRPLTCATHRAETTTCEDRCLARRACPIAPQQAYSAAQSEFHMRSLTALWREAPRVSPPRS